MAGNPLQILDQSENTKISFSIPRSEQKLRGRTLRPLINWEVRALDLSETERSDTQFFCSLFPASELASRPCHSWLDPNNCIHTTEGAITTNGTNVITYKRNTLHYIRCYGRSLLQKERLLQKDQCLNLQKVHFVLQKDTPRGCHHLPVCRIRRRHDGADEDCPFLFPSYVTFAGSLCIASTSLLIVACIKKVGKEKSYGWFS